MNYQQHLDDRNYRVQFVNEIEVMQSVEDKLKRKLNSVEVAELFEFIDEFPSRTNADYLIDLFSF